jgi:hypothetical protein
VSKLSWTPWHEVVHLRDDLKSGELSLSIFAADLYDVVMGKAKPIYKEPAEFFALTYPTYNLRELAKDVALRLAGRNDKAVRQLALTYGGGKTHTLITMYHLFGAPDQLPDLPALHEFTEHIGMSPPKARVVTLPFDKLDVEKGMEVRAPSGETRWLKQPWSVLAFQIAGADGLRLIHADDLDAERESAPAEPLLVDLLALPARDKLATLVLIDEVLMYARGKVELDPGWRVQFVNFCQYLTQAATKVDRCAIVASLLATDPAKSDTLGKEITNELYAIFRRQRDPDVQPVVKEDVAEVLRRRFFTSKSIENREAFRPHVVSALQGISALDEQTRKDGRSAEDRYLQSYPFHPDLTEVFYTKWTNLESFQRTRGVLRTFALALRDAERWDESPLVAVNVFLGDPKKAELSEAARELTIVAGTEEYEGRKQEWTAILQGELEKARVIQRDFPSLDHREIEQAVFATFVHSQPIGQKALTRELLVLLGHTRPDSIELQQALRRWSEESWFLDDAELTEAAGASGGPTALPKAWRLGSRPNLKQMHHDARLRIEGLVEQRLKDDVFALKSLTAGASAAGARVHNLPDRPSDVGDDGEFHFVVLGPSAASSPGKPSPESRRFIAETTGSDRPRVSKNAVVIVTPSLDGLEAARDAVRDYLGWDEVRTQLKGQPLDPVREAMLHNYVDKAKGSIPAAIRQAYSIVVALSAKGEIEAFKITVDEGKPLFSLVKEDKRSRIQDTAVSADALMPDGPYDLWKGETSRPVRHIVGAFAERADLPKMLNRKAILDTLIAGCVAGSFVMRLTRPDRSVRTFWWEQPDDVALKDDSLEAVLPEAATLGEISHSLLRPKVLPGLWERDEITVRDVASYFAGGHVVRVDRGAYEEPVVIPKVEREAVVAAVEAAVRDGELWLTSGPASILGEDVPAGLLTDDAVLQAPPKAVPTLDLLSERLPDAWVGDITTALALSAALSKQHGKSLPWVTVRAAIDGAIRGRLLERTTDSGLWPCDFAGAGLVKLRAPRVTPPPPPPVKSGVKTAEAELDTGEIQDLADGISAVKAAATAAGCTIKFTVAVELSGRDALSDDAVEKVNEALSGVSAKLKLK